MRLHRLIPLLALAAAVACRDSATAPTDAELVGTWSIAPTATLLPGSDLRQMTVSFGPTGAYTVETATWQGGAADGLLGFEKSAGSVSTRAGELRFHPTTGFSIGRQQRRSHTPFDPAAWDPGQTVSYQVVGNRLVLHLPPVSLSPNVVVLTRRTPLLGR